MEKKFLVSPSPHIRTKETVETVMWDVVIAMIPILISSIYFFGWRALIMTLLAVISAIFAELCCQLMMKREIQVFDGSAVITGMLLAFVVSPILPYRFVIIGSIVSIVLGKMVFGGLGHNIFNPALIGRTFLLASWPVAMTRWVNTDGTAGATILGALKGLDIDKAVLTISEHSQINELIQDKGALYWNLFIGNVAGSLGETSALAILLGGLYLLYRGHITWHTPTAFIGTVGLIMLIFGHDPMYHILSGGLVLGAVFMATDMVTSPYTWKGKLLFGIGAGILVSLIRLKGGYPEGVCYAILIMNGFTPLINRYTRPRVFGEVKNNG